MQGKLQQKPTHFTSQKNLVVGAGLQGKCPNIAQNIYNGCWGHLQRLSGYIQRLPRILAKVASDKGKCLGFVVLLNYYPGAARLVTSLFSFISGGVL